MISLARTLLRLADFLHGLLSLLSLKLAGRFGTEEQYLEVANRYANRFGLAIRGKPADPPPGPVIHRGRPDDWN